MAATGESDNLPLMAPHVALRPLTEDDRDRVLVWRNSPEVSAYMYTDDIIAPDAHAQWLAAALTDHRRCYWIIEMDAAPVGVANLYDIDPISRRASWAFYLGDPSVRGKSIGAMVELLVLDIAFGEMDLCKLWCEVLDTNIGVVRLHQRFGFRQEALLRRHVRKHGESHDVVGLGLLAEEWAAGRAAMAARLREQGFEVA
jgi:UDP-4-amino-4,6-dideoxy-N-acetyl-beta-L-altrosamine N-acetyltransferase